jgi:hypothetical protein
MDVAVRRGGCTGPGAVQCGRANPQLPRPLRATQAPGSTACTPWHPARWHLAATGTPCALPRPATAAHGTCESSGAGHAKQLRPQQARHLWRIPQHQQHPQQLQWGGGTPCADCCVAQQWKQQQEQNEQRQTGARQNGHQSQPQPGHKGSGSAQGPPPATFAAPRLALLGLALGTQLAAWCAHPDSASAAETLSSGLVDVFERFLVGKGGEGGGAPPSR